MTYGISWGRLGRVVGVSTARRCPDPGAGGRRFVRRRSISRAMVTHLDALVLGQQAEMRAMPYSGRGKGGAAGRCERAAAVAAWRTDRGMDLYMYNGGPWKMEK